jgi:HK97 gp10 family phage protein
MRASIYVVARDESNYDRRTAEAKGKNPKAAHLLSSQTERPNSDLTAIVAVAAEYGQFIEFGARNRPPQPFFFPAVVQCEQEFYAEIRKLING